MKEPVKCRTQMRKLYEQGAFGNRLLTWNMKQLEELVFPVALMYDGGRGGSSKYPLYCAPLISVGEVNFVSDLWKMRGAEEDRIVIIQSTKGLNAQRFLQGEVTKTVESFVLGGDDGRHRCAMGYYLLWSPIDEVMRKALEAESHVSLGISAYRLMKDAMDEPSWDNLQRLIAEYPDHVIEFSVFNRGVGSLGHNTIFFEVRRY